MTRRMREELRENVIIAARSFDVRQSTIAAGQLREALWALDAYEAAAITGAGARSVKGAPETSAAAAGLAEPIQFSMRHRIVRLLIAHNFSDDELERQTSEAHQTVSSARNWLVEAGWVRDSGVRRLTRSKRQAVVWELTPTARQQLKGGGS